MTNVARRPLGTGGESTRVFAPRVRFRSPSSAHAGGLAAVGGRLFTTSPLLDGGFALIDVGAPNDVIRTFREKLMTGVRSVVDVDDPDLVKSELSPLWHRVKITRIEVVYPDPDRRTVRR